MDFTLTADDFNIGTLVLRLTGLILAVHGAQKLFGAFNGPGIPGTIGMTTSLGLKYPRQQAYIAGVNEFGGGLLLLTGFLTPLGATMLIATMVVAVGTIHISNGFFGSDGGYEFNLLLVIAAFAIVAISPGEWSLDNALGIDLVGATWALISLVAGTVAGAAVLLTRETPPGR